MARPGWTLRFGPEMLRAIVQMMLEEFNRNRQWHGKPEFTADQVKDRFIELYDQYTLDVGPEE